MIAVRSRVEHEFDQGAAKYDELATVQQQVADNLFDRLKGAEANARRIVDLGCGTGQLIGLARASNQASHLLGVDISAPMLARMRSKNPSVACLQVNLMDTGIASESYDLVLSSSAFQWVDLSRAFSEAARIATVGGTVAIACFGRGTIAEWRRLWGLNSCFMPQLRDLQNAAEQSGLSLEYSSSEWLSVGFACFDDALASIRELGAGGSKRQSKGLLSRTKFNEIKNSFQRQVDLNGAFSMNYRVHYLIARKLVCEQTSHLDVEEVCR